MSTPQRAIRFPLYVWQVPVRIWHWTMVLCMLVLWVTGYFIGSPLPSVPGEASENFVMGYIRFAHFSAAYIFACAFVGRVYWAFAGNEYAREIFVIPLAVLKAAWWRGFFRAIGNYLFILPKADHHAGHNPLASMAMFTMYVLGAVFMIVTGFALYGEGLGRESWAFKLFSSWVIPLFGQSQDVHTWHHLGAWYLLWFTIVHMYFVVREDITSGLTVVSSMVSGWRSKKD